MRTQAAKERKLFFLAAALVLVVTAQGTIPAEASRTNSPPITATLEPSFASTETLVRITEETDDQAENRFRLFEDLSLPPHPLEWVLVRKTASGVFDCGLVINVLETGGLAQDCVGPSFQGLWTDPTTGLSYARNRWYDARTASWLSEDPMGAFDSPNLYAFVGWAPHMYTDPLGFVRGADAQLKTLEAIAEVQGTDVETLNRENAARTARFIGDMPEGFDNPSMTIQRELHELGDDPFDWLGTKWQSTKDTAAGIKRFALDPIGGTRTIISQMEAPSGEDVGEGIVWGGLTWGFGKAIQGLKHLSRVPDTPSNLVDDVVEEVVEVTEPKGTPLGDLQRHKRYLAKGGTKDFDEWYPLSRGGRLGGAKHRGLIAGIERALGVGQRESFVGDRFADFYDPISDTYHQAGRRNKRGDPIARERRAIDAIRGASPDSRIVFHDYTDPQAPALIDPDLWDDWVSLPD